MNFGLTEEQIAKSVGVHYVTLLARKKRYAEFREAINDGKCRAVAGIANAMYNTALEGNVSAQIFFLKNRAPDQWKDSRQVDHGDLAPQTVVIDRRGCDD